MKINSYSFGEINVNDNAYRKDIIIFSSEQVEDWWRNESHKLCAEDIIKVIKNKPSVLIVGTGAFGMMTIQKDAEDALHNANIRLVSGTTEKAILEYNKLAATGEKVAGAFHLTC
ncbi:MAG: hypothetical protein JW969_10985 [Spirochaetales bacterium]|nr:hypothetical protein [Spirochaetales bacterium]